MCRFIETLRGENGEFPFLSMHEHRMNATRRMIFRTRNFLSLKPVLPALPQKGIWKCRVIYGEEIFSVEMEAYQKREIRKLFVKETPQLVYSLKSADRREMEAVRGGLNPDEEVVFSRKGFLTDSFFSNLAFFDGRQWVTPLHPLLKGIRRKILLNQKKLTPLAVSIHHLYQFEKISLINAMLNLGELEIPVNKVFFLPD